MIAMRFERFIDNLKTPFDLYIQTLDGKYKEVAKKGEIITERIKEDARKMGATTFYIENNSGTAQQTIVTTQPKVARIATEEYNKYLDNKANYHSVSKALFLPGNEINFSLYEQAGVKIQPIVQTTTSKFVKIPDTIRNATALLIEKSAITTFRDYLEHSLSKNKHTNNAVVSTVIKETGKMNIRSFIDNPLNKDIMLDVVKSANDIVNSLKVAQGKNMRELMSLRSMDAHLYNHCLNVAVLASSIAQDMQMSPSEIETIAIAAMMHDVGKSKLPKHVLYKVEKLTADEYNLWKTHVGNSVIVAQNNGLPQDAILGIKHHHEKLSGKGYPYAAKSYQISKIGRILAVVDSYDSLISPKIGKHPLKNIDVLNILMNDAKKGDLDGEYVRMLVRVISSK